MTLDVHQKVLSKVGDYMFFVLKLLVLVYSIIVTRCGTKRKEEKKESPGGKKPDCPSEKPLRL